MVPVRLALLDSLKLGRYLHVARPYAAIEDERIVLARDVAAWWQSVADQHPTSYMPALKAKSSPMQSCCHCDEVNAAVWLICLLCACNLEVQIRPRLALLQLFLICVNCIHLRLDSFQ